MLKKEDLLYFFIRALTWPIRYLPYSWIRQLGRNLGRIAFYCMTDYRKRSLSNLALANDLHIGSEKELREIAKQSFENLAINVLEYPSFDRETNFSRAVQCVNPEIADTLYREGKGIIFFCGHQSNWEVLFLDGTCRMKGIAIGKAIKNRRLYRWVLSIREKNGGRIIAPRNAVKEGLRALRKGIFIGIVGDQGMPDSGYSFPFLGRRAWTSTTPALLAYRTNSPIIVATTRRTPQGYRIHYSDPIWPNQEAPAETDVVRMMDRSLTCLQNSIKESPGEWLWQHNRWKQQTPQILYKRFRYDSICVILPDEKKAFEKILPHLATIKQIYSSNFLFLIAPHAFKDTPLISADEITYYSNLKELKLRDYRFKLVYNFSSYRLAKHYLSLSAFEVIDLPQLLELAKPHLPKDAPYNLSDIMKRALCRPGTIW
jgi:KDO2-lipid IV(A) lauroyltransferase